MKAMAVHKVKLIIPDGEQEFRLSEAIYSLDYAEELGLDLPYSCRAGSWAFLRQKSRSRFSGSV